jgi:hypothetical protein
MHGVLWALEGLPVYGQGGGYLGQVAEVGDTDMIVVEEEPSGRRLRVPLAWLSEMGDVLLLSKTSGQVREVARADR